MKIKILNCTKNFDKLKSIEFLGLLMEANDHLKGKNKGK